MSGINENVNDSKIDNKYDDNCKKRPNQTDSPKDAKSEAGIAFPHKLKDNEYDGPKCKKAKIDSTNDVKSTEGLALSHELKGDEYDGPKCKKAKIDSTNDIKSTEGLALSHELKDDEYDGPKCKKAKIDSTNDVKSTEGLAFSHELKDDEYDGPKCKETKIDSTNDVKSTEGLGVLIAGHYNKIEDKGVEQRNLSRILHMRNFNNWVKSVLILNYLNQIRDHCPDEHPIIAFDLGCGKGGDLFKWEKGNVRHLICADIADTSVAQCRERYEFLSHKNKIFSAEFIVADFTKVRLKNHIKFPKLKLDIVSSQFSFHYCFESLSQAETLVRNISELLCKGGFFIATIPDANKIVSLLQASGTNSFGNEVFKITFPEDRPANPPLFGDLYNFSLEGVVNCPEFLVHFPTLTRLCKKYNLVLYYKKSFEDFYKRAIEDREHRNLLFKMKALEVYPPNANSTPASSNEDEYAHARKFMEENNVQSVKTLSKSEWEAICLYLAVGFKKVA